MDLTSLPFGKDIIAYIVIAIVAVFFLKVSKKVMTFILCVIVIAVLITRVLPQLL